MGARSVGRSGDVEGASLSGWERLLAISALVGCLLAIVVDGHWRWLALPCLAALFFLALRRTTRIERALTRSQEDYRHLVDLPVQATFIADAGGALLHVSRRWSVWTGLSHADTPRSEWVAAIHPDDREQSTAVWNECIQSGRPYDQSFRIRMRDGEYRWFRSRAFPQRNAEGTIIRWVGAVEDIHDMRVAEEQLRHTAGLLESIGSSTDSLIYAKDREGRMLYGNRALEALTGLPLSGLLGKTDREWSPNPAEAEAFGEVDRLVIDSGQAQDVEEIFTSRDGRTRRFRSLKSPLRDHSGAVIGVVGVSTDITDQREADEREKLLTRELDHRAKNLLAVVQSVVSLTRAATLAEFKAAVEGRIQSLGRAHSMLAASRWEGADLERVLSEELAPYRGPEEARVSLSGPSLLLKPAAAQSLSLVIHELATNAVKYGALSVNTGELEVVWEIGRGEEESAQLRLRWEERGGPAVTPRSAGSRSGFGSRLIRSSVERQLGGTLHLDWAETGLIATMELALDRSLYLGSDATEAMPG